MLKGLKKALAAVDMAAFGISAVSLVVLSVTAVFFRFILNSPIVWAEEVQLILVVWAVFFGASIAIREKGHIAVDIFFDAMPKKVQRVMSVLIWVIVAVSIGAIAKLEMDRVLGLIQSGLRTSILRLPSSVEYIGVVIACVLMLLNHVINGIEALRKQPGKEEVDHE